MTTSDRERPRPGKERVPDFEAPAPAGHEPDPDLSELQNHAAVASGGAGGPGTLLTAGGLRGLQGTVGNQGASLAVQRSLAVGDASSPLEAEAEAVANRLAGATGARSGPGGAAGPVLQPGLIQRAGLPTGPAAVHGELNDATTAAIQGRMGRGSPLPKPVRSQLETALSTDLGSVRLHTDGAAHGLNQALNAKAFTTGSDIFFRQGAYQPSSPSGRHLLTHELTHVVQQGPGPTGGGPGAGPGVVQRFSLGDIGTGIMKLFKGMGGKGAEKGGDKDAKPEGSKDAKPEGGKDAPPKIPQGDSEMLADSRKFEASLGRYLFNHGKSNYAAASMTDRMITALIGEFNETDVAHQGQLTKALGGDKASSAGQVGTKFDDVWTVVKEGNLRERMTALMNAMFGSFKTTVLNLMDQSKWDEAESKGLNVTKLKRRKGQMGRNPGAKDLYRDPGNPLDRKNISTWQHTGNTRTAEKGFSQRTVGDLEDQGIGLSPREKALQFGDKGGEDLSGEKVKWQEGGTYWKTNDQNKWVSKVKKDMHMPVIAGPSGTALRMFQMWEMLKKPIPAADWRAAILGWMLTSNDHSFHEMMLTSADYGLPYTPGVMAYHHVDPLTEDELRQNVAIQRSFPDEHDYARRLQKGDFQLVSGDAKDKAKNIGKKKGLNETEVAVLTALVAYTDEDPSSYKFMNNALKGGVGITPAFYKFINEDKFLKDRYAKNQFTISQLINESAELSKHATTGMKSIDAYQGTVWRGFKAFMLNWKKNSEFTEKKFASSSKDRGTAEGFANKGMGWKKVLVEIASKSGKPVSSFSLVGGEEEVLFAPGTRFRVVEPPAQKPGDEFWLMKWEEVSAPPPKKQEDEPRTALKNFSFKDPTPPVVEDEEEDVEEAPKEKMVADPAHYPKGKHNLRAKLTETVTLKYSSTEDGELTNDAVLAPGDSMCQVVVLDDMTKKFGRAHLRWEGKQGYVDLKAVAPFFNWGPPELDEEDHVDAPEVSGPELTPEQHEDASNELYSTVDTVGMSLLSTSKNLPEVVQLGGLTEEEALSLSEPAKVLLAQHMGISFGELQAQYNLLADKKPKGKPPLPTSEKPKVPSTEAPPLPTSKAPPLPKKPQFTPEQLKDAEDNLYSTVSSTDFILFQQWKGIQDGGLAGLELLNLTDPARFLLAEQIGISYEEVQKQLKVMANGGEE